MRIKTIWLLALVCSAALAASIRADLPEDPQNQPVALQEIDEPPDDWEGPQMGADFQQGDIYNNYSPYQRDMAMRNSINEALSMERSAGMNDWVWRDRVESRLVGLGQGVLPYIHSEMPLRRGFELDALDVAAFRLENAPLNPNHAILTWAQHLPGASAGSAPKIMRVVGPSDTFPHHLFYVVESPANHARTVIALAADSKVQNINTDADLQRFFRIEFGATTNTAARQRLVSSAAFISLARFTTTLQPTLDMGDTNASSIAATASADGHRVIVTLSFSPEGVLTNLISADKPYALPPSIPAPLPTTPNAPPAIPD